VHASGPRWKGNTLSQPLSPHDRLSFAYCRLSQWAPFSSRSVNFRISLPLLVTAGIELARL